jgi:hypothetical protein
VNLKEQILRSREATAEFDAGARSVPLIRDVRFSFSEKWPGTRSEISIPVGDINTIEVTLKPSG